MASFIITGATSMIGIALCRHISSIDGNTVFAVCRQKSYDQSKFRINKNFKVIYSDLEQIDGILNEIDNADVFINLAWTNTDHEGRDNAELQMLNVEYTKCAMKVAASLGCKLFVEAGSQAEYGSNNGLITEDSPCHPETEYGKAKLRVWEEGSALCESLGIKYLHLRIFSVFGKNDRPWTLIMSAVGKMIHNNTLELSSCQQSWNYLYAADCAKQIYRLCEYASRKADFKADVYHIASKNTRSLKDYIEEMKSVLKSTSTLHYGNIIPDRKVTLNPSITKTKNAIGAIDEIAFAEAIKLIAHKNKNVQP